MSEHLANPPRLQLQEVLAAVEPGGIIPLPVGEPRDSRFDTTFQDLEIPSPMPEGIHDVREQAAPSFEGWRQGDIVRGTFTISVNHRLQRVEAIAESVDTSRDHLFNAQVAHFTLGNIDDFSTEEIHQFSLLGMRRLVADVQVSSIGRTGYLQYRGGVRDVFAVEQPFDGDTSKLRKGEPLFVEGVVEGYSPGKPTYDQLPDPSIVLGQPHGRSMAVSLGNCHEIFYGSSAILAGGSHDLVPPHPIIGDRVQVATRFTTEDHGWKTVNKIICKNRASMHLLETSQARVDAEHSAETAINHLIDIIGSVEDRANVRKLIGNYIAGLLRIVDGQAVSNLSEPHRKKLIKSIESMGSDEPHSPTDSSEWPMGLMLNKESAAPLVAEFGKEVLMMSPAEFRDFTLQVVRGSRPTTDIKAGKAIFGYMAYSNKALLPSFTLATLTNFYDNFITSKQAEADNQPRDEYAKFMLEKALDEGLDGITNQNMVSNRLVKLMFDTFGSDQPPLPIGQPLLTALSRSLIRCSTWNSDLIIKHPDGFLERNSAEVITSAAAYEKYSDSWPAIRAMISSINEDNVLATEGSTRYAPYDYWLERMDAIMAKLATAVRL